MGIGAEDYHCGGIGHCRCIGCNGVPDVVVAVYADAALTHYHTNYSLIAHQNLFRFLTPRYSHYHTKNAVKAVRSVSKNVEGI